MPLGSCSLAHFLIPLLAIGMTTWTNTLDIGSADRNENSVSSSLAGENAIAYVSGYLLKRCFTKHQCETCKTANCVT